MNTLAMDTPLGGLLLCEREQRLCAVKRLDAPPAHREQSVGTSPLLENAKRQLEAYFAGALRGFDLPLAMDGSAFEIAVWQALLRIPYGQTITYGQLAAQIGKPGAARAVGRACGKNPLLIVVACHRVLGSGGKLTGFAAGLQAKKTLLALEGVRTKG